LVDEPRAYLHPFADLDTPAAVHAMPDHARAASRSKREATAIIEFCRTVSEAVLPIRIPVRFLFDRDDRRDEWVEEIERATQGRASYLAVRELENLFLSAPPIHRALGALGTALELTPPTLDQLAADLAALL
jgi:hypothetical protein